MFCLHHICVGAELPAKAAEALVKLGYVHIPERRVLEDGVKLEYIRCPLTGTEIEILRHRDAVSGVPICSHLAIRAYEHTFDDQIKALQELGAVPTDSKADNEAVRYQNFTLFGLNLQLFCRKGVDVLPEFTAVPDTCSGDLFAGPADSAQQS